MISVAKLAKQVDSRYICYLFKKCYDISYVELNNARVMTSSILRGVDNKLVIHGAVCRREIKYIYIITTLDIISFYTDNMVLQISYINMIKK